MKRLQSPPGLSATTEVSPKADAESDSALTIAPTALSSPAPAEPIFMSATPPLPLPLPLLLDMPGEAVVRSGAEIAWREKLGLVATRAPRPRCAHRSAGRTCTRSARLRHTTWRARGAPRRSAGSEDAALRCALDTGCSRAGRICAPPASTSMAPGPAVRRQPGRVTQRGARKSWQAGPPVRVATMRWSPTPRCQCARAAAPGGGLMTCDTHTVWQLRCLLCIARLIPHHQRSSSSTPSTCLVCGKRSTAMAQTGLKGAVPSGRVAHSRAASDTMVSTLQET